MEPDQRETAPNVARNASIVSVAVMASRVLGLVRDQVFAIFFGAGMQYDAFLTAFRIPNLLRDLFAEGALSAAFVTTFSQVLNQGREGSDPIIESRCNPDHLSYHRGLFYSMALRAFAGPSARSRLFLCTGKS